MAHSASFSASHTIGGLAAALGQEAGAFANVPIAGISVDHRKIKPGFVFFALPGSRVDGASFTHHAAANGATLIIGRGVRPSALDLTTHYLAVEDPRRALALAAAYLYPRQPEIIVAVTGTAGKTSVVDFTRQIFAALGHRAASLGTLGVIGPDGAGYGGLTTPDPVSLHESLDRLASEGVSHVALEASSHGLDQKRLDGVRLCAAGFTNLGRDHLDYHPTLDAYFAAKLRLFEALLPKDAPALINLDGDRGAEAAVAAGLAGHPVFTIGRHGQDITLNAITPHGFGQSLDLTFRGTAYEAHLPLMGAFQVQNALLAAGFALVTGEKPERVFPALGFLKGVPGRLERVGAYHAAPVFVDYAHKPEALEHALRALRPCVSGRLVVVFGCGGNRDAGKRPIMGEIAARRADHVIITDDNPRHEAPEAIRAAIRAAAPHALEIPDRAEAIRAAISGLEPGDALLIAGKGHESGQIIGDAIIPFSDHAVAQAIIAELS